MSTFPTLVDDLVVGLSAVPVVVVVVVVVVVGVIFLVASRLLGVVGGLAVVVGIGPMLGCGTKSSKVGVVLKTG